MPIPFGRFSPTRGITVDRTGNTVVITGAMECYGPDATPARAREIQDTINKIWTATFPDGISSRCTITVTWRDAKTPAGNMPQIDIKKMTGPSNVNKFTKNMELDSRDANAFTWVCAHEFGHILGLEDKYNEGIVSKVKGKFGGERTTTVESGYDGNIMAVDNGAFAAQNITDVAVESDPSSWWVNDDDHVRAWVNHHTKAEIAALARDAKLQALKILMSGWISDEDMRAIEKILAAVERPTEANFIRGSVDPLDFTSLGQRMRFRIALRAMPVGSEP